MPTANRQKPILNLQNFPNLRHFALSNPLSKQVFAFAVFAEFATKESFRAISESKRRLFVEKVKHARLNVLAFDYRLKTID
jgi:hypothetical protein